MTTDEKGRGPAAPKGPASGRKNAEALAAALRANLQRRKARVRALRAGEAAAAETPEGAGGPDSDSEGKWTR